MQSALRDQYQALFDWAAATNIPVHLGEYGVGREGNQGERDTDLVREYYSFVTNLFIQRGMATCVWDDQGWFGIMLGTNQFVYGLQNSLLSAAPPSTTPSPPTPAPEPCTDGNQYCEEWAARGECENNPGYMLENCRRSCGACSPAPTSAPTPAPSPTPPSGGGCCQHEGQCNCGEDGTGWCNGSPSNCNMCLGTWNPSGAAPSCNGSGGGCCRNGDSVCGCGSDGTGWCNDSPSNCNMCTGTWDSNAPTPSCR